MRTLLTLICSFALISFTSAAQPDQDQGNNPNKGKKEKGASAVQQQPIKGGGSAGGNAKFSTQGTTTTRAAKFHSQGSARMIHDPTLNQGSGLPAVQSTAKGTSFNKTTTFNRTKNVTINKNYKIKQFNLGNRPSGNYKAVQFSQNYKIAGANKWRGAKYQVFVNYRPQWHDQGWWRSHHNRIVFVFGAPYFWDSGYFYPAWGYEPGANYYYDGPIYASNPDVDPGQEVANVQSALQEQGFYQGEIDGVLGAQTRAALAEYQSAQGLEPTGAIDEPTMESLGMA
jgi:hypothetical protein